MTEDAPGSDRSGDHRGFLAVRAVAAGAVGLLLQFGVLSVAQSIGLFGPDVLGRLAAPVGGGTAVGAVAFVAAGLVVWPALFGPFARRLDRGPLVGGLAFGLLLWPLFTLLFAPAGASGADLALYGLFALVAHALYGFGIGVVVALLGPTPETARGALGALFASPSGSASASAGAEPTATADDSGTDPSSRAAAATASADAANTATTRTTGADTTSAPSGTAGTSGTTTSTDTTSAPPGTADTSGSGAAASPSGTTETTTATTDAEHIEAPPTPEPAPAGDVEGATEETPAVPEDGIVRPEDLPPLLDFEQALDRIRPHIDSAAADQFELVEREYARLKRRGAEGRHPIVSDMANHLSGLRERLPQDSPARRWVDSMDNRVSMYLRSGYRPSDTLHLAGVELLGPDGEPTDVTELREQAARIRATVVNGGERSGAVAIVTFRHENGVLLRSVDLSMGYIDAGERKTLDTTVYVPSIASSFEVRAAAPEDGRQFLPEL